MKAEDIVEKVEMEMVVGLSVGGHIFNKDDAFGVCDYYGRKVIHLYDENHWYVVMDIETGEIDYKADDSIYDDEVVEVSVSDLIDAMKGKHEQ